MSFYSAVNSFGPNAFALPPCLIIVNDEFIQLTAGNDEISAVLAHEIGHIHHRHTLRRVVQNSLVSFAILLMSGDATQIPTEILSASAILMELNYSRNFEKEPDRYAHDYMTENSIALHSFPDILRRMETWRNTGKSQSSQRDDCRNTPAEAETGSPDDLAEDEVDCEVDVQHHSREEQWRFDWPSYFSTHPDTEDRAKLFSNQFQ